MAHPECGGGSSISSKNPIPSTLDTEKLGKGSSFPINSEASFNVVTTTPTQPPSSTSTFMQNQITLQRSPSTKQAQASALTRQLSVRSNGSHTSSLDSNLSLSNKNALISAKEGVTRGRTASGSSAILEEIMNNCTLGKTSSQRSTKSAKSVRSVHAVGAFPLGTLRVHSPSPTRSPNGTSHACQKSGDIFVVRDVGADAVFGYDTKGFTINTGDSFDGVKYFPHGAHFVWGGSGSTSVRTGFWFMTKKLGADEYGEVYVKRWNKYDETLEDEHIRAEDKIQRDTLPEYFESLMEYNLPSLQAVPTGSPDTNLWRQLTSCIKGALLTKVTSYEWNKWQVSTEHDYTRIPVGQKDGQKETEWDAKKVLRYVFPKEERTFTKESVGRDRTEQVMDTSHHVSAVITGSCTYEDSDEIIGELQFCYITGMILGNAACQEHWGHIINVVFKAYKLCMVEDPKFGLKMVEAAHACLLFDENGFADGSIFANNPNFEGQLKSVFSSFKANLDDKLLTLGAQCSEEQKALGKAFSDFESFLWKKGWELRKPAVRSGKVQLEDGEYVDAELKDYDADEERVLGRGKKDKGRTGSRSNGAGGLVRWKF